MQEKIVFVAIFISLTMFKTRGKKTYICILACKNSTAVYIVKIAK